MENLTVITIRKLRNLSLFSTKIVILGLSSDSELTYIGPWAKKHGMTYHNIQKGKVKILSINVSLEKQWAI